MKLGNHIIVGIHVHKRKQHAQAVQHVLTEFGDRIKTRLGLHEVEAGVSSGNGLILVEMSGTDADLQTFTEKLASIEGVDVQSMVFKHD